MLGRVPGKCAVGALYRRNKGHASRDKVARLVCISSGHHAELAGRYEVLQVLDLLRKRHVVVKVGSLERVDMLATGSSVGSHGLSLVLN